MVLLPGCKCCGKKDCWRCYGKNFGCDDLSFEVEYVGFQDMDEFLTVDTTEEKGLPIGTTFGPFQQTDSLPDMTQLDFLYVSEDKTSTQFGGRLTCNQPGDETVLNWSWFTVGVVGGKPKVLLQFDDSFINYAKDGYVDFAPSPEIQKAPGEYPVFGVIRWRRNDGTIESVGKVQILVRVFDMNDAVPSEYQCFENPPVEDGWVAAGKCHPDEATCAAECPPADTTPPGGRTMTKPTGGPGTELKRLLGSFGIKSKEKGCGCRSMALKMDRWQAEGCRQHKAEIIDHLAKEAEKRKLPFIRLAAEKLVDLAIRRAEK